MENNTNFIQKYWPQTIFFGSAIWYMAATTTSFEKENEKFDKVEKSIQKLDEKINTITEYLNEEDNGVRGDSDFADKQIEEKMILRDEIIFLKSKIDRLENDK